MIPSCELSPLILPAESCRSEEDRGAQGECRRRAGALEGRCDPYECAGQRRNAESNNRREVTWSELSHSKDGHGSVMT